MFSRLSRDMFTTSGVTDRRVIGAMLKVPRHAFVPKKYRKEAYDDTPLPIGREQTISQPSLVALMTQLLKITKNDVVLEIGTGSGYQTAILSELAATVYSIERIPSLANRAKRVLNKLGYQNIEIHPANGTLGFPEKSPFDKIIVTAGSPDIPQPLIDQLKEGGRIVIPVGSSRDNQQLLIGIKKNGTVTTRIVEPVRFVPLIGEKGWKHE